MNIMRIEGLTKQEQKICECLFNYGLTPFQVSNELVQSLIGISDLEIMLIKDENKKLRKALSELHKYCDGNRFLAKFIKAQYLIENAGDVLKKGTK